MYESSSLSGEQRKAVDLPKRPKEGCRRVIYNRQTAGQNESESRPPLPEMSAPTVVPQQANLRSFP